MKTYSYGARPPSDRAERQWVQDQLWLARRYRNALVASHRAEYERVGAAQRDERMCPGAMGGEHWIDSVRAMHRELRRKLRGESGLGWGTYQLVENDVQRSRATAKRDRGEMKFSAFDGSGRVGAAIQACSEWSTSDLTMEGEGRYRVVTLPMGRGRSVRLSIVYHRPLPPGRLYRAYIHVMRVGTRFVWGLRVVVDDPPGVVPRRGTGVCAVNFGWRVVKDGVRVAVAVGTHGLDELVLPRRLIDRIAHAEELRSIADREAHAYLGDARRRSRMRRAGLAHPAPETPWPAERRPPWKSLRHWALQDRHLYEWECESRARAIRSRKALMLAWAQKLAALYETVTVEDYSLDAIIRRESSELRPESRHIRFLGAPGELRELLKREFGRERIRVVGGVMTLPCHVCGEELQGDRVRKVKLWCERCNAWRDQDENNAKNQLVAEPRTGTSRRSRRKAA